MVTQNILHACEGKPVLLKIMSQQMPGKILISLNACSPISELPSNMYTIVRINKIKKITTNKIKSIASI